MQSISLLGMVPSVTNAIRSGDVYVKKQFSSANRRTEKRAYKKRDEGRFRGSNPGPSAPKAEIIPLDQSAAHVAKITVL